MPEKQTREGIEAELNASESERISLQLQEVVREAELVEKDLRALEDEHGIPEFARSRPLPDRMAAVGMSRAGVERLSTFLDALLVVALAHMDLLIGAGLFFGAAIYSYRAYRFGEHYAREL